MAVSTSPWVTHDPPPGSPMTHRTRTNEQEVPRARPWWEQRADQEHLEVADIDTQAQELHELQAKAYQVAERAARGELATSAKPRRTNNERGLWLDHATGREYVPWPSA